MQVQSAAYIEDGEIEQEADGVDAYTQNIFQLANNRAGVLECQSQVLAALVH